MCSEERARGQWGPKGPGQHMEQSLVERRMSHGAKEPRTSPAFQCQKTFWKAPPKCPDGTHPLHLEGWGREASRQSQC
jgi:hypothetical protein